MENTIVPGVKMELLLYLKLQLFLLTLKITPELFLDHNKYHFYQAQSNRLLILYPISPHFLANWNRINEIFVIFLFHTERQSCFLLVPPVYAMLAAKCTVTVPYKTVEAYQLSVG